MAYEIVEQHLHAESGADRVIIYTLKEKVLASGLDVKAASRLSGLKPLGGGVLFLREVAV